MMEQNINLFLSREWGEGRHWKAMPSNESQLPYRPFSIRILDGVNRRRWCPSVVWLGGLKPSKLCSDGDGRACCSRSTDREQQEPTTTKTVLLLLMLVQEALPYSSLTTREHGDAISWTISKEYKIKESFFIKKKQTLIKRKSIAKRNYKRDKK